MGHLSLQYGTYLYTIWDILYSIRHLTIPYGTSIYAVWDIYLHSIGNLSLQYGTSTTCIQSGASIYTVWDISHYRGGGGGERYFFMNYQWHFIFFTYFKKN